MGVKWCNHHVNTPQKVPLLNNEGDKVIQQVNLEHPMGGTGHTSAAR